jgi:hypothetical protein
MLAAIVLLLSSLGSNALWGGKAKDIACGRNGARPNSVTIRKWAIRAQTSR